MKNLWMMWKTWQARRNMQKAHAALGRAIAAARIPGDWPAGKSYGPGRSVPDSVEQWLQQPTRKITDYPSTPDA